jgi:hypothetical protein
MSDLGWRAVLVATVAVTTGGGLLLSATGPAFADASDWTIQSIPNPTNSVLTGMGGISCPAADSCTAVGESSADGHSPATSGSVGQWNGSTWTTGNIPTPPGSTSVNLAAVSCPSTDVCTAVGSYLSSDGASSALVESWKGSAWSIQAVPIPAGSASDELSAVSCPTANACIAVGSYTSDLTGGSPQALVESWDAYSWSIDNSPDPPGSRSVNLSGVSCSGFGACTAVGNYSLPPAFDSYPLTEFWNGSSWTIENSPVPTGYLTGGLSAVSCSAVNACTAVGNYQPEPSSEVETESPLVEQWNGISWSVVASPNPGGSSWSALSAVSCTGAGSCAAVGGYWQRGAQPALTNTLVESWDGIDWSIDRTHNPTSSNSLTAVSCNPNVCAATGAGSAGDGSFVESDLPPPPPTAVSVAAPVATLPAGTVVAVASAATPDNAGWWTAWSDGAVTAVGDAVSYGGISGQHLDGLMVGMAPTPTGHGYWLLGADGGVFCFGDAQFYGSTGGERRKGSATAIDIASTGTGHGYYSAAGDGGVFSFGDAGFYGSLDGTHLNKPLVGMAVAGGGRGYWLAAGDGGVFTFGDAAFYGSIARQHLRSGITGITATPDGGGYWLLAKNGTVYTYGDANNYGNATAATTGKIHAIGLITNSTNTGYWITLSNGTTIAYNNPGSAS